MFYRKDDRSLVIPGRRRVLLSEYEETGEIVGVVFDLAGDHVHAVDVSSPGAGDGGSVSNTFFLDHFDTAGRIVGRDQFLSQVSQERLALSKCLGVRKDGFYRRQGGARIGDQTMDNAEFGLTGHLQAGIEQQVVGSADAPLERVLDRDNAEVDLTPVNRPEHVIQFLARSDGDRIPEVAEGRLFAVGADFALEGTTSPWTLVDAVIICR